jgi:predicted nucleic acid-binding protein
MTLTDTGPLVALIDKGDSGHTACQAILPSLSPPLITTWPCLTEAMYLLGSAGGYTFQKALWRLRTVRQLVIHELTVQETDRMQALMDKYRNTPMDLADSSVVAAAETLSLDRIFTLDRHFYAYRTEDGKAFEVIP